MLRKESYKRLSAILARNSVYKPPNAKISLLETTLRLFLAKISSFFLQKSSHIEHIIVIFCIPAVAYRYFSANTFQPYERLC